MGKDYYQILNIAKNAGPDDIKAAYRKLAFKFHPDVNADIKTGTTFKQINEAYTVLRDNRTRRLYDRYIRMTELIGRNQSVFRYRGCRSIGPPRIPERL